MGRRVVVIGHGMVGARFAEQVRRRDPAGERVALTVLGAESRPAYNRVLLSSALAGPAAGPVPLLPDGWPEEHAVDVRTGVAATVIDRDARVVRATDGTHRYDELVLATGCRAWLPPVDGLVDAGGAPADGVSPFRDADDCERILAAAGTRRSCCATTASRA